MAEDQNRDVYLNENLEKSNSSDEDKKARTGNKQKNKGKKGSNDTVPRENTSSGGYGSSQKNEDANVAPLDADLNELPSKRRTSGSNQTGSGLG